MDMRDFFVDFGNILVGVLMNGSSDYAKIDSERNLVIPVGVIPDEFLLVLAWLKKNARLIVVQKDIAANGGGYHTFFLNEIKDFAKGFKASVLDCIKVARKGKGGKFVRTMWHETGSNHVDIVCLDKDGDFGIFQIGIFTHDNGLTWKLYGEWRWYGQLYKTAAGKLVAKPLDRRYGPFVGGTSGRDQIFQIKEFKALLKGAKLLKWTGTDAELKSELPDPSMLKDNEALVQWFILAAGQSGLGIGILKDGSSVYIHGIDVRGFNPTSAAPLLERGNVVTFEKKEKWGHMKDKPDKITGVVRVR